MQGSSDMTLRIAHIISGLGVGGAERNLVNLVNAMSSEYCALIFLGPRTAGASFHDELDPEIDQIFCRVRRLSFPIGLLRLAVLLRQKNINVVHTHMYYSNLYGAIAAKLAGVPVIITSEHGENPWKKSFHRWLEKNLISAIADIRFCVSEKILEIRRDIDKVPTEKLRLTANGTVLPKLPNYREVNNPPVIGAVGRFITAKNYPLLLDAIAVLRDRGYDFKLQLVGDGPERNTLLLAIDKLELTDIVELPGMVSDVDHWYRNFDVYVSSSTREGQPVAMLEAMAWGLPVVVTDVGAVSATVRNGESGLIVPPENSDALADALARILDDGILRSALGRAARDRIAAEYSVDAVVESQKRVYCDILSRKQSSEH
jgi:glycosyltransferase involved in cell wall biosynthesis